MLALDGLEPADEAQRRVGALRLAGALALDGLEPADGALRLAGRSGGWGRCR